MSNRRPHRKHRAMSRGCAKNSLHGKTSRPVPSPSRYHCIACQTSLFLPGGYAQTGMCGPCATGEAETIEEFGESW